MDSTETLSQGTKTAVNEEPTALEPAFTLAQMKLAETN
jgi:hypothetical protein